MNRHLTLLFIVSGVLLLAISAGSLVAEPVEAGDVASIEAALRGDERRAPDVAVDSAGGGATAEAAARSQLEPVTPPSTATTAAPTTTSTTTSTITSTTTTMAPIAEPVGLRIERLDVDAPVDPYGISPDGQMAVPHNVTDVAWYEPGPGPGEGGSAVLAAHVSLRNQGHGVFYDLKLLEPGDLVHVNRADGTEQAFRVEARTTYLKSELPLQSIFSTEGPPVLTLITCGGGFNSDVGRFDSNVVVYAVPLFEPSALDRRLLPH